jgi:diguanylate cyclase (GGDEF)-like protein
MFKGYELGAVDYLYKPISNELLRSKVKVFMKLQLQSKIIEAKSNELEFKIMELEKVKTELHNLTCTDQLTEVTNRRGFDEAFGLAWRRAIRNRSFVTLLMIDIDSFKNYNDTYGHVEGDVCLKKVARRIADTLLRPFDQVARYGGEEFVVLLPETDLNGGEKIAEDIRHNIETMNIENKKDGTSDVVTVSIGVASVIPGAGDEKESLTKWADGAMYQAKESGRNRCCFYVNQH